VKLNKGFVYFPHHHAEVEDTISFHVRNTGQNRMVIDVNGLLWNPRWLLNRQKALGKLPKKTDEKYPE
jgi:hypothetical protein